MIHTPKTPPRDSSTSPHQAAVSLGMTQVKPVRPSLKAKSYKLKASPTIGIIGSRGRMGKAFTKLFGKRGLRVIGADLRTKLRSEDVAKKADILLIAVPISVTPTVIERVALLIKPNALITDLTSIKTPAINAMKRCAPSTTEILGLHPMFHDSMVSDMRGQTIVVCPIKTGPWSRWFFHFLRHEGANLQKSNPQAHDHMMSVIQGITHLSAIATGMALQKLGVTPQKSLRFSSPIYRLRLEMVGRVLHQDPKLYAEIALDNPMTKNALNAYQEAIKLLAEHVNKHNMKGFVHEFQSASKHLGSFTKTAYQNTNKLLKILNPQ